MAKCPFCNYSGPSPVLREYEDAIVFEPLNPVTPGHLLVVPRVHVEDVGTNPEVSAAVMRRVAEYIQEAGIRQCNIITSRGGDATQTVFHLHVHIVPRGPEDGLKLPWSL